MGQGDDDLATTPSSSPLCITHITPITHGRVADESMGCQQGGEHGACSDGNSDIGDGEDHAEINKTFLDTETLCSFSSFYPFNSPRTQRSSGFHPTSYASDSFSFTLSTSTDTGAQPRTEDLGEDSFLLSRQTSAATMAFSTRGSATMEATKNAQPAPIFSHFHRQREESDAIELRLPTGSEQDEQEPGRLPKRHHDLGLFSDLDYDHLFPDTFTNRPFLQHRPSSSRSHLRSYQRTRSPLPNASRYLRVSSDGPSPAINNFPSRPMTREEFEALPPTIQRKYFSTLERLRFVSPDSVEDFIPRSAGTDQPSSRPSTAVKPPKRRRRYKNRVASEVSASSSSQIRTRVSSIDQRFYASLPDKIKRRHLTEEEQLFAHYHRQSLLSGSADESLQKTEDLKLEGFIFESPLASPGLSESQTERSSMHSRQGIKTSHGPASKRTDSFYDSFRWLEEDDELDLRLYLDDYHINLREEIPLPNNKSRRPSFRRHLSINKLPFGRPSLSLSRPGTRDAGSPPAFTPPSQSPVMGYPVQGHLRRKSRALSLISPNRQPVPSSVTTIDTAATHYQDPETRMKLRLYLASPQKFDEAIEFGFPSMDEGTQQPGQMGKLDAHQQKSHGTGKLQTFLADDRSSTCSDDGSMADPESPKTPELFEKPTPPRPARMSTERTASRGEFGHAPSASREMTLRMTLTRPDLRSNEDEIYGWRQAGGRGLHSRGESSSGPVIFAREGNRKDSIERQLAALDECDGNDTTNENGVVKRIWNRVRRS